MKTFAITRKVKNRIEFFAGQNNFSDKVSTTFVFAYAKKFNSEEEAAEYLKSNPLKGFKVMQYPPDKEEKKAPEKPVKK